MRLNVKIQRQIIQYHHLNPNFSNRQIARMLNISHKTSGKVIELFKSCNIDFAKLMELNDAEFQVCLKTKNSKTRQDKKPEPDWEYINAELKKRDMTLTLLWQEYKIDCPQGLSYSQFAKKYKAWKKTNRLSMRQQFKCGEQVLVDFCGRTMLIQNPDTGEIRKVQVFVGVLGASSYIFAHAVESQKVADWLRCHIEMFRYFGGVSEQVVTDNLKSAVITNTKTRLHINQSYAELAEYYNFAINPTRPRKPKDKGLAETSVQIVQRGILAKLRHQTFFSVDELNEAIAYELIELNDKTTKRFKVSRYEQFLQFDKPFLAPKPLNRFEVKNWHYQKRVDEFYQVSIDDVRYSVPYQYAHRCVDIAVTEKMVEIYYQRQRIASHMLATQNQVEVIDENHMPTEHKFQTRNNPAYLKKWAKSCGDNAYLWIDEFLSKKRDFAVNVRKIRKLKDWVIEKQFESRLDDACKFAITINSFSVSSLKNMINSQSYLRFDVCSNQKINNKLVKTTHANIRGADYYKNLMKNKESSHG